MKKKHLSLAMLVMLVGLCLLGTIGFNSKASAAESPRIAINRLYNPNSGEHLFTPSNYERDLLVKYGWKSEGIGYYGPGYTTENKPYLYRVYNPNAGDHHYTTNFDELQNLIKVGWHDDNIGFYVAGTEGEPVYRLYNPNAVGAGANHFNMLKSERDHLIKVGWKDEGIGFNAYAKLQ